MYDIVLTIIMCICSAFGIQLIGGYIFYRLENLKTVDDGMYRFDLWCITGAKKIGSALFWWVMEETGHTKPEKIINQGLCLTDEDFFFRAGPVECA